MTQPESQPVKLLLVDDLDENLLVLEALLRSPELELLTASSGTQALELLLVHDVALALIDVQMPEMDGFELAELMRGSDRTCRVPIIFVTAGAREQSRIFQGYDAGAVDFLFKPVEQRILRHKVDTFVELYRQRRQLAEQMETIRRSEELRRRVIESSEDLIVAVDPDGRVHSLNAKGKALLGDEAQPVGWTSLWESVEDSLRCLTSARAGELARFQSRGGQDRLGSLYWDVVVTPMRDARGRVEKALAVARDVTELRRLNEELADTLRLNETFVAAVGHDLRTPLNNVVMSAEILLSYAPQSTEMRVIERLRASAQRMSKMIDELFDLARARLSGGIPVVLQDGADLATIVDKIVAEIATGTAAHPIEVHRVGDARGRWDADRLAQVLTNLVGNALRHGSPEAPVRVELDGAHPYELVLAVKNRGQIPSDVLPCLFEPFRRGQTRIGKVEGLGLGLFIVQQIVQAHGGTITATSTDSETTFRVVLPRSVESVAERTPGASDFHS